MDMNPFRAGLESMWNAVTLTWDEAWNEHLHAVQPDPGFSDFYDYCKAHNVPISILSSGLRPMIERIMDAFVGDRAREIEIISNEGVIEERSWKIIWRDDTPFGHDKSHSLIASRTAHPTATHIFIGDGVSDISAAQHADLLFVRRGRDLESWCARQGVPFTAFDTFGEIREVVKGLVEGRSVIRRDKGTGFCEVMQVGVV
ncbi:HAD-like domain-containing protein [Jimgerdemannia flammicorona]|uniref:HAD-like domain-containing protein n=1 Tax=Jimgerdemannia flammicorona TaxID=994334 RepID=A0A433PI67_9FUNG|nr:HAD-like domain-containing protein [Jimgerdemannia flammicorona]